MLFRSRSTATSPCRSRRQSAYGVAAPGNRPESPMMAMEAAGSGVCMGLVRASRPFGSTEARACRHRDASSWRPRTQRRAVGAAGVGAVTPASRRASVRIVGVPNSSATGTSTPRSSSTRRWSCTRWREVPPTSKKLRSGEGGQLENAVARADLHEPGLLHEPKHAALGDPDPLRATGGARGVHDVDEPIVVRLRDGEVGARRGTPGGVWREVHARGIRAYHAVRAEIIEDRVPACGRGGEVDRCVRGAQEHGREGGDQVIGAGRQGDGDAAPQAWPASSPSRLRSAG